jgi:competence protein ComEC
LTFRQLWPEVQTAPQLHTDDLLKAPEGILKDKNDDSCVIEISDGYHKVLLTGDISTKVESKLLKKYPHLIADILLVPHHGSNTSSSDTFISKLSPKIALVSAGFLNRWQMPRAKVVKRYQAHHINLINTADVGEVTLTFSKPTSNTAAITQKMTQAAVMKTVEQQNYRYDFWPFWFAN